MTQPTCRDRVCVGLPEGLILLEVCQAGLVVCVTLQALHCSQAHHVCQLNLQAAAASARAGGDVCVQLTCTWVTC
jgi:hypothetical protein